MIEEKVIDVFRPIHYLGSKLRMLDFIENSIDEIDSKNRGVCDLFSGSGSVSFFLAHSRPVVSVDIQEYSRVICSAILEKPVVSKDFIDNFISECRNSEHTKKLYKAVEPLINYEEDSIHKAIEHIELESLCDIIENGSLISYQVDNRTSAKNELMDEMIKVLENLKSLNISDVDSLSIRYFGGIYFAYKQTCEIDSILYQIEKAPENLRDFLRAPLLSTASDAVNTVGKQFAQPIRPRNSKGLIKTHLGKAAYKDRNIDILELYNDWLNKYYSLQISNHGNKIIKDDYNQALEDLPDNIDFVYADPPYTRDHYSRFYHVLETISLRDLPEVSTMVSKGKKKLSRGLYRMERHQSPFCIRSQAPAEFEKMFRKISSKGLKLLLSYSPYDDTKETHPRVVKMDFLTNLANKYFESVEIRSVGEFVHSKLNSSEKHLDASSAAEVLIVCH